MTAGSRTTNSSNGTPGPEGSSTCHSTADSPRHRCAYTLRCTLIATVCQPFDLTPRDHANICQLSTSLSACNLVALQGVFQGWHLLGRGRRRRFAILPIRVTPAIRLRRAHVDDGH